MLTALKSVNKFHYSWHSFSSSHFHIFVGILRILWLKAPQKLVAMNEWMDGWCIFTLMWMSLCFKCFHMHAFVLSVSKKKKENSRRSLWLMNCPSCVLPFLSLFLFFWGAGLGLWRGKTRCGETACMHNFRETKSKEKAHRLAWFTKSSS